MSTIKAKWIVIGGYVLSARDGQEHYINTEKLCSLYRVDRRECLCIERRRGWEMRESRGMDQLDTGGPNVLRPRGNGDYTLPKEQPHDAN